MGEAASLRGKNRLLAHCFCHLMHKTLKAQRGARDESR